jgi:hypothetical protein
MYIPLDQTMCDKMSSEGACKSAGQNNLTSIRTKSTTFHVEQIVEFTMIK